MVQERFYLSLRNAIFRPRGLQTLLYTQEVRTLPCAFLSIRAFKHIPHLLLHCLDGGDRDSTCTVDLPRTGPVPDFDELEADIEVLREVDGVEWLLG